MHIDISDSFGVYLIHVLYSGYIPSEFNFVLIPCGTNIFQTKKAFPQYATCTKWLLRTKIKQTKSLSLLRTNIFPDEIYPLYGIYKWDGDAVILYILQLPGITEFSTNETMGHSGDRLVSY